MLPAPAPAPVSLNPCFSGTYSRSVAVESYARKRRVLILVLVEHTLGENKKHEK